MESDWSSASYFYSIAALSEVGSQIELSAYKENSLQGDKERSGSQKDGTCDGIAAAPRSSHAKPSVGSNITKQTSAVVTATDSIVAGTGASHRKPPTAKRPSLSSRLSRRGLSGKAKRVEADKSFLSFAFSLGTRTALLQQRPSLEEDKQRRQECHGIAHKPTTFQS